MQNLQGIYKCVPNTTVCDYDEYGRLTMFAFLKYQQQAAEEQVTALGYGFDDMKSHGLAFLVYKSMNLIERMPAYGEKFYINTWNSHTKGTKFYRGYDWYSSDGGLLARGCNIYVLVDTETHRPVRPSDLYGNMKEYPQYTSPAFDYASKTRCDDLKPTGKYKVLFTDLDLNHHLNNARYAQILQNFLPLNCRTRDIKAFSIDFVRELKVDSEVEIMTSNSANTTIMSGTCDGVTRFRGRVDYRE